MKQRKLRTKWMAITTTITFSTIFIFTLIIILFLSSALRYNEVQEAKRSASDINNLLHREPIETITSLDLNASLGNFQKVVLYNQDGKKLTESSNDNTVEFSPSLADIDNKHISVMSDGSIDYLIVTTRIDDEYFHGYTVIIHSLEVYNRLVNSLYICALIFGIVATLITACVSYIFSSQITKPLITMSNKMTQIRRNGFQEKLELNTNYFETDDLIDTFNEMMEQLEESFNQQRQFVEDASHELRTPLQIIQGHLNLIQRWGKKDPAVLEESLNTSLEEMTRITSLVEELLMLTKENNQIQTNEQVNVDVNAEIESKIKALEHLHTDYTFEFKPSHKPLKLRMNQHQFEQILVIFIDNAMKYDQIEKHIHIETRLKNNQISIEITDHGVGIPKEDIDFIFDRFYRVDKSRSRKLGGNGLGLSIAQKIIEHNNGSISVESEVGEYTTFKIIFAQ